jgi:hypothetical protein
MRGGNKVAPTETKEATQMEMPQGRLLVGKFVGVTQVTYGRNHQRAGEPVAGLYEVTLQQDGRDWPMRASFFSTDQDSGEPTRFQSMLNAAGDLAGQLVGILIKTTATAGTGAKAFVNDTALALYVLEPAKAGAKA